MKYNKYIIFISLLFVSGCNYLDIVPENDIETIDTQFEQRGSADGWVNGLYGATNVTFTDMGQNVAFLGADEFTAGSLIRQPYSSPNGSRFGHYYPGFKISEGLQMSQEPYGNYWDKGNEFGDNESMAPYDGIRYMNIFLEKIWQVYNMEDAEKQMWSAEIKALKAFYYFELVRRYGPIVLVPTNLEVNLPTKELQQQRQHVDTCFNAIVRLLDEAAEILPYGNQRAAERCAYFSKEAALALKARVLVYAASPLFNGNPDYSSFKDKSGKPLFSTSKDKNKWKIAADACDVAVNAAIKAGHKLFKGLGGKNTQLLNKINAVEFSTHSVFNNPEFIWEAKNGGGSWYTVLFPNLASTDPHYNQDRRGSISPSMKMVETYYTENGLPIDQDNSWNYSGRYKMSKEVSALYTDVVALNQDVLQLHLRREPRFYATIAADRTYWVRGPIGGYQDNNLLIEPYYKERFGSRYSIIASDGDQNINGYWLKKFSNSEISTRGYRDRNDETFPMIRMAELYLLQAEAWNEWLDAPDERVYAPLNVVRERAGIKDIVTAWETYSKNPAKVHNQTGMRDIIHQETDIELAFEGHRFFNVRRWKTAYLDLNEKQMGWNILGDNAQKFYNFWQGPVVVWSKCKFTAPRDYLFPIKAEEIMMSSLVQNPGW